MDSRCHALTAPHVRESHQTDSQVPICSLYETFDAGGRDLLVPPGVYNLEDLRQYCGSKGWCPYFFTRWAIGQAQVILFSTLILPHFNDAYIRLWCTATTTFWTPKLLR